MDSFSFGIYRKLFRGKYISSFAKSGIWPPNLDLILGQISHRPVTPPSREEDSTIKTLYIAKAIYKLKLSIREEVIRLKTEKMFKALDHL